MRCHVRGSQQRFALCLCDGLMTACYLQVDFAILDEADQMLDIGFADDVEKILSEAPKERQTMLFSATMPSWVKKLTRRHQRDPLVVDLVGDEEAGKMAESIRYAWLCSLRRLAPTLSVNCLLSSVHAKYCTSYALLW